MAAIVIVITLSAACSGSPAREYELRGQIVAVDPARQEVTIKHGDIPRFMPAMTMVFRVANPKMLDSLKEGDKVKFTADKVNGAITQMD